MSKEQDRQEHSHLQHEAEHAKPHKKVSVMGYLAILFAAAFLLLLLSYFMQQRANETAFSGLKDSSASALESVQKMIAENKELHDQVDQLEAEVDRLNDELAALEEQNGKYFTIISNDGDIINAMDWLWRIQRAYSRGSRTEARELAEQFMRTDLPQRLPSGVPSGLDGPSPAEQYQALLEAMGLSTATAEP